MCQQQQQQQSNCRCFESVCWWCHTVTVFFLSHLKLLFGKYDWFLCGTWSVHLAVRCHSDHAKPESISTPFRLRQNFKVRCPDSTIRKRGFVTMLCATYTGCTLWQTAVAFDTGQMASISARVHQACYKDRQQ